MTRSTSCHLLLTLALACLVVMTTETRADDATANPDDANALIVLQFIDALFNQGDADAVTRQVREDYVQHNAAVPDGLDALRELTPVANVNGVLPTRKIVGRYTSEDGLVAVYSRVADNDPDDDADVPDLVFVDIFRVEDGWIVEHWDVIQLAPVWLASGELAKPALWAPDAPDQAPEALVTAQAERTGDEAANRAVIERLYAELYNERRVELVDQLFAQDFRARASDIGSDRDAYRTFIEDLGAQAQFTPRRMIAQGDLVIAQTHWTTRAEQRGLDFCGWNLGDVFRFDTDGKIAEQWRVKARVACQSVNAQTPF